MLAFWHHRWHIKYFSKVYNLECFFSFWGAFPPDLHQGLCPWTPLGDFRPLELDPLGQKNPAPPLPVSDS